MRSWPTVKQLVAVAVVLFASCSGVGVAHAAASPAPAWVPADLAAGFNAATNVFDWTDANTARYRAAMRDASAGTGVAEQVVMGDSTSAGYVGNVYDEAEAWPAVYRSALAAGGAPVAGSGWVRAADVDGSDPRWSFDANWTNDQLFQFTASAGAVATYAEPLPGTSVSLRYTAWPGASFSLSVDGATSGPGYTRVSAATAMTYQTVTLSGLPAQSHTLTVTTLSAAVVAVVAASVSTALPGIVVDNVSQGGARASGSGLPSWSQLSNSGSVGGAWGTSSRYPENPAAVWIALGGNDINAGTSPDTVTAAIRSIAAQFPSSDVFLVLEYQFNEISTSAWTAYAQALYRTAAELHVPLFDEWAQIGSYPAYAAAGYAGDAVAHLDAAGYAAIGNWVAHVASTGAPVERAAQSPPPGTYHSVAPFRALDTRIRGGAVPAGGVVSVQLTGAGGVPSDASAAVLNVTAVAPTGAGYLTAYADGTARPLASNLDFVAGQTVPDAVIAPIGADGRVAIYNGSAGLTHVLVDVNGYVSGGGAAAAAGAFVPARPTRILDTRVHNGAAGPVAGGGTVTLQVSGAVVPAGASAVAINVTVTAPTSHGFITVWPHGVSPRPVTSSLNFAADQTNPNLVVVPLSSTGQIDLYNSSTGTVQLIGDVQGYFIGGGTPTVPGTLRTLTPTRILDTRSSSGAFGPVAGNGTIALNAAGSTGIPYGVTAVVLNVTETQPTGVGYVTVFGDGSSPPKTSSLDYASGQTRPNAVIAPIGSDGKVAMFNGSAGTVQLLADVSGYFVPDVPAWSPTVMPSGSANSAGNPLAVSCAAAGDCVSVGSQGVYTNELTTGPLTERRTGTSWTDISPPMPGGASAAELDDVSCSGSTTCVAVGGATTSGTDAALVELLAGATWTPLTTPLPLGGSSGRLSGVSCPTTTRCVAVGVADVAPTRIPVVATLSNGSLSATAISVPNGYTDAMLTSVSCVTASSCVAVGAAFTAGSSSGLTPMVATMSGSTWITTTIPPVVGALSDVNCTSSTSCVAVGETGGASTDVPSAGSLVETLTGSTWTASSPPQPQGHSAASLQSVSCSSAGNCTAVGFDNIGAPGGAREPLAETLHDGQWLASFPTLPADASSGGLHGLDCVGPLTCVATGTENTPVGTVPIAEIS